MNKAVADLTAIAEIGIFAAAGVMIAFIYTIVLLPVLLSLTPLKPTFIRKTNFITMDRLLGAIADFSTRHPFKITIASLVFFFVRKITFAGNNYRLCIIKF